MARKILLADDSVTAQNMGRRILADAGYDVTTVNNGSAALKKIAEQKPDLIVLDVYMPGYGGLEVCQRLKENRETARIPVLLTVGKLEPFKADEARRVRADAFIIKPFEASELLTALTKLEDKIVPQPEAYKPGRFAKAIAAVDQIAEKGEGFGDSETGWKDRLKFPSAKPSTEPEPESVPTPSTKFRDLDRGDDFKPAEPTKTFERPMPAGLPPDITPEEIAAITAAAATFGGKSEAPEPTPVEASTPVPVPAEVAKAEVATTEAAPVETAKPEAAPATFASSPETSTAPDSASAVPAEIPVPAAESPAAPSANDAVNEVHAPVEVAPETKFQEETDAAAAHKPADADVLAAIATLVPVLPSNGHDASAVYGDAASEHKEAPFTVASAIAQLAGVGAVAVGPRWVAEEVPVESAEAALALEGEMEKALSALAAVEAASHAAAVQEASASFVGEIALSAAGAPVEISESVPSGVVSSLLLAAPAFEATPEAPVPALPVEAISEVTTAQEPEPVPAVSEAVANANVAAPVEEAVAVSTSTVSAESVSPEPKSEVALAAAAGAGQSLGEPASGPEGVGHSAFFVADDDRNAEDRGEAELDAATAAAWEHWQQIRETVVGSGLTAQVADATAATLKQVETVAGDAAEEDSDAGSAADPHSIASIVDSVLAELKPKLVEEIARKMNKENKENREKEKKKKK